jgi:sterol desaturase/sphingolipid hydroxylase (fatty acid hydroxylase superfamily)
MSVYQAELVRSVAFAIVLAVMAVWEMLHPVRPLAISKPVRWFNNLAIVALNAVVMRVVFPLTLFGLALLGEEHEWGALHLTNWAGWVRVVVSVVVLDGVIYLQHVMFHAVPLLWRFHRMHHADLDFDVTTGLRFHTCEMLISLGVKITAILALGPPALGVLVFEVLLTSTAMFNHSNVRLPKALERLVRAILVTPDMHRVHHSIVPAETNSNFGFSLPWWDFLMGTYRARPAAGDDGVVIGLPDQRDPRRTAWLPLMLALPFTDRRPRLQPFAIEDESSADAAHEADTSSVR